MTPIASMVRELLTRGVAAEVIVLAVEAAELAASGVEFHRNSADPVAERRRAYDRDRKRIKAEFHRNSTGIPPDSANALLLTSLTTSESEDKKERKKVRARKAPASGIPPEFQPNEKHFEAADRLGIPRQAVFEKSEDMRVWAQSKGEVRADWDATLHGFLRRDAEKLKSTKRTVHDAARDLLAKMRSFDEPAPDGELRDGTGSPPVRLLSSR